MHNTYDGGRHMMRRAMMQRKKRNSRNKKVKIQPAITYKRSKAKLQDPSGNEKSNTFIAPKKVYIPDFDDHDNYRQVTKKDVQTFLN